MGDQKFTDGVVEALQGLLKECYDPKDGSLLRPSLAAVQNGQQALLNYQHQRFIYSAKSIDDLNEDCVRKGLILPSDVGVFTHLHLVDLLVRDDKRCEG